MQQRAAARGEEYVPPLPKAPFEEQFEKKPKAQDDNDDNDDENDGETGSNHQNEDKKEDDDQQDPQQQEQNKKWLEIAERLQKELDQIETNEALKAKDRRSAKRKAEAIAAEDAGIPVSELLQYS